MGVWSGGGVGGVGGGRGGVRWVEWGGGGVSSNELSRPFVDVSRRIRL